MRAKWSEGGESRAAKQRRRHTDGLAAEKMPGGDQCHIRGRTRLFFSWVH